MTQAVLPTSQLWGEPSLTDKLERAPSRDRCTHIYMCTHMHAPIAPHTLNSKALHGSTNSLIPHILLSLSFDW